jgi:hypothetical protein
MQRAPPEQRSLLEQRRVIRSAIANGLRVLYARAEALPVPERIKSILTELEGRDGSTEPRSTDQPVRTGGSRASGQE